MDDKQVPLLNSFSENDGEEDDDVVRITNQNNSTGTSASSVITKMMSSGTPDSSRKSKEVEKTSHDRELNKNNYSAPQYYNKNMVSGGSSSSTASPPKKQNNNDSRLLNIDNYHDEEEDQPTTVASRVRDALLASPSRRTSSDHIIESLSSLRLRGSPDYKKSDDSIYDKMVMEQSDSVNSNNNYNSNNNLLMEQLHHQSSCSSSSAGPTVLLRTTEVSGTPLLRKTESMALVTEIENIYHSTSTSTCNTKHTTIFSPIIEGKSVGSKSEVKDQNTINYSPNNDSNFIPSLAREVSVYNHDHVVTAGDQHRHDHIMRDHLQNTSNSRITPHAAALSSTNASPNNITFFHENMLSPPHENYDENENDMMMKMVIQYDDGQIKSNSSLTSPMLNNNDNDNSLLRRATGEGNASCSSTSSFNHVMTGRNNSANIYHGDASIPLMSDPSINSIQHRGVRSLINGSVSSSWNAGDNRQNMNRGNNELGKRFSGEIHTNFSSNNLLMPQEDQHRSVNQADSFINNNKRQSTVIPPLSPPNFRFTSVVDHSANPYDDRRLTAQTGENSPGTTAPHVIFGDVNFGDEHENEDDELHNAYTQPETKAFRSSSWDPSLPQKDTGNNTASSFNKNKNIKDSSLSSAKNNKKSQNNSGVLRNKRGINNKSRNKRSNFVFEDDDDVVGGCKKLRRRLPPFRANLHHHQLFRQFHHRPSKQDVLRWNWSDMIPTFGYKKASKKNLWNSSRVTRRNLWNKYGRSMHFLTLEFFEEENSSKKILQSEHGASRRLNDLNDEEDLETQFGFDYMHRNKRTVEAMTFFVSLALIMLALEGFMDRGYFDKPILITGPLFFVEYLFFLLRKDFFYAHFQSLLFAFAMVNLIVMMVWQVYIEPVHLPGYNRKGDYYTVNFTDYNHSNNNNYRKYNNYYTNPGINKVVVPKHTYIDFLTYLILILTVFRLRFAYFMFLSVSGFSLLNINYNVAYYVSNGSAMNTSTTGVVGSNSVNYQSRPNFVKQTYLKTLYESEHVYHFHMMPRWKTTLLVTFLISTLCYSREVLIRKDFIQANMALKETQIYSNLLENVLPKAMVNDLNTHKLQPIARSYESVTILFASIHIPKLNKRGGNVVLHHADHLGVEPHHLLEQQHSSMMSNNTDEYVHMLNTLLMIFDQLAEANGVERIPTKSNGSHLMGCTGAPTVNASHAKAMARFALQLVNKISQETRVQMHIAIASGSCHAGVVGICNVQYNVWGEAVDEAARVHHHVMTNSSPMKIHITDQTQELLENDFVVVPHGENNNSNKNSATKILQSRSCVQTPSYNHLNNSNKQVVDPDYLCQSSSNSGSPAFESPDCDFYNNYNSDNLLLSDPLYILQGERNTGKTFVHASDHTINTTALTVAFNHARTDPWWNADELNAILDRYVEIIGLAKPQTQVVVEDEDLPSSPAPTPSSGAGSGNDDDDEIMMNDEGEMNNDKNLTSKEIVANNIATFNKNNNDRTISFNTKQIQRRQTDEGEVMNNNTPSRSEQNFSDRGTASRPSGNSNLNDVMINTHGAAGGLRQDRRSEPLLAEEKMKSSTSSILPPQHQVSTTSILSARLPSSILPPDPTAGAADSLSSRLPVQQQNKLLESLINSDYGENPEFDSTRPSENFRSYRNVQKF